MERSSFSFTYNGSIADAITEAQTHKKLFVVYISGYDDVSTTLEQSTWMDQRVAESISKYCIFLHLVEGTVDALQFSAIYPQKSIPSISVVGYNGVMIWQHEGFLSAENLAESVQKAWSTLQLQETAAAFLTAALASKKSDASTSSIIASSEKGGSSGSSVASTSTNKSQNSEVVPPGGTENEVDERNSEKDKKIDENNFSSEGSCAAASTVSAETDTRSCDPGCMDVNPGFTGEGEENAKSGNVERVTNCPAVLESSAESDGNDPVDHRDSESQGNSKMITKEVERTQKEKVEVSARSSNPIKPNDVHLNIRLPNGTCLQMRFSLTDTLRSVKNYIDENAVSSLGDYDLAIPYPRKVLTEQDMTKTMSELGFAGREALIVVPHQHVTVARMGQSPSYDTSAVSEADPKDSDNGYFAFAKRILSYVNPFSYVGGTSHSSSPEAGPSSLQQQGERYLQPGNNANTARGRTSSRFGGNIHTLRDVEGEDPPSDRNVFWNGNSTQFGGDDKN